MSKWTPFMVAAMVALSSLSCREAGSQPAVAHSAASGAGQTRPPAPDAAAVPSPGPSPVSDPTPQQNAPEPPDKGSAKAAERQPEQDSKTLPAVSAAEIERGNTKRKEIALTFDAGASAAPTPKILASLDKHKVQATMFLTGQWAEANPGLVRQIASHGFELANHSYSHPEFTKLTNGQMREELAKTEAIVQKLTGRSTRPFFRPPFGDRDDRVRDLVAKEGYFTVFWTLDSADWRPEATATGVRDRVLRLASPGSIIVFHLGSEPTAQAIEEIVVRLQENGFSLVGLTRLLSDH